MKITIAPYEKKQEKLDNVKLYNIIKRAEEDLLATNPSLKEFLLKICVRPSYISYSNTPKASYDLRENESVIELKVASYDAHDPQKVYLTVSEKILQIKHALQA